MKSITADTVEKIEAESFTEAAEVWMATFAGSQRSAQRQGLESRLS